MRNFKESLHRPNSSQINWMRSLNQKHKTEPTVANQQNNGLTITYTLDSQGNPQMNIEIQGGAFDSWNGCTDFFNIAIAKGQPLNANQYIKQCQEELAVLASDKPEKSIALPITDGQVQIAGATITTQEVDALFGRYTMPMNIISEQSTSLNTPNIVFGVALLSVMYILSRMGGRKSENYTTTRPVSRDVFQSQKIVQSTKVAVTEEPKKYKPNDPVVVAAIDKIGERYGKNVDDPMVRLFARTTQDDREEILRQHYKAAPELAERAIKEFRQFIGLHGLDAGKWVGTGKWRKKEDAEYNIERGAKAIDKADESIMKFFFRIIGFR